MLEPWTCVMTAAVTAKTGNLWFIKEPSNRSNGICNHSVRLLAK